MKYAIVFVSVLAFPFAVIAQNHVLSLDGHGDYVRIPSAPELQGGEEAVKTIEAWFLPTKNFFPVVTTEVARIRGGCGYSGRLRR